MLTLSGTDFVLVLPPHILSLWKEPAMEYKHIRRHYPSVVDTGRREATSEESCHPFFVPTACFSDMTLIYDRLHLIVRQG